MSFLKYLNFGTSIENLKIEKMNKIKCCQFLVTEDVYAVFATLVVVEVVVVVAGHPSPIMVKIGWFEVQNAEFSSKLIQSTI